MMVERLVRIPGIRRIIYHLERWRSHDILQHLPDLGQPPKRILDIGAGSCVMSEILRENSHHVYPVDVKDISVSKRMRSILYNGQTLPVGDKSVNIALLVTVLHHIPDPEALLTEAARIAEEIIIVEDVFDSCRRKYYTYVIDSLLNLEIIGHPHSNKTDREWSQVFTRLNLQINSVHYYTDVFLMRHAVYHLRALNS